MGENTKNIDKYLNNEWVNYLNKKTELNQKWEKMSQRFGKIELIKLFKIGINKTKRSKNFYGAFKTVVIGGLLQKTGHANFKKNTYKSLMSLFGSFGHFYKKYQKNLIENLKVDINNGDDIKNRTKQGLFGLFIDKPNNNKLRINEGEEDYMIIDDEGNVLPPE